MTKDQENRKRKTVKENYEYERHMEELSKTGSRRVKKYGSSSSNQGSGGSKSSTATSKSSGNVHDFKMRANLGLLTPSQRNEVNNATQRQLKEEKASGKVEKDKQRFAPKPTAPKTKAQERAEKEFNAHAAYSMKTPSQKADMDAATKAANAAEDKKRRDLALTRGKPTQGKPSQGKSTKPASGSSAKNLGDRGYPHSTNPTSQPRKTPTTSKANTSSPSKSQNAAARRQMLEDKASAKRNQMYTKAFSSKPMTSGEFKDTTHKLTREEAEAKRKAEEEGKRKAMANAMKNVRRGP